MKVSFLKTIPLLLFLFSSSLCSEKQTNTPTYTVLAIALTSASVAFILYKTLHRTDSLKATNQNILSRRTIKPSRFPKSFYADGSKITNQR